MKNNTFSKTMEFESEVFYNSRNAAILIDLIQEFAKKHETTPDKIEVVFEAYGRYDDDMEGCAYLRYTRPYTPYEEEMEKQRKESVRLYQEKRRAEYEEYHKKRELEAKQHIENKAKKRRERLLAKGLTEAQCAEIEAQFRVRKKKQNA